MRNIDPSDASDQRIRIATVGYVLLFFGLSCALLAMALDRWTGLRGLELVIGCIGLSVSIVAAILSASDGMRFSSR